MAGLTESGMVEYDGKLSEDDKDALRSLVERAVLSYLTENAAKPLGRDGEESEDWSMFRTLHRGVNGNTYGTYGDDDSGYERLDLTAYDLNGARVIGLQDVTNRTDYDGPVSVWVEIQLDPARNDGKSELELVVDGYSTSDFVAAPTGISTRY